ncbi:tRNA wybutosine-synthesizing protein 2 homolog isoform X2 [Rhodnius prolixus]|uniref:tRNA wybutosine-synthesizing protein 2 homolog isoform X2 n=1 Tax=Rhodnius prolixus TaxID=13249 RepID=UPI003D18B5B8
MSLKLMRHENIRQILICFMKELGLWEEEMKDEIPRSFKKYGDHLLFSEAAFANRNWYEAGEELWKLVSNLYKGKAVAIGGSIQNDSYRTPRVRLIYGDTSIVNFVDNHVKYTWNIEKNMFCSGNVNERHRIGKLNCEGEVIADLFAGIGVNCLTGEIWNLMGLLKDALSMKVTIERFVRVELQIESILE